MWPADAGRPGGTGEEGTGVLGDFGAGRRCFVAKVTPEGVRRDLAREAAGNLTKRQHIGQATRVLDEAPARDRSLARFLPSLDKRIDSVRPYLVAFSKGGDSGAA